VGPRPRALFFSLAGEAINQAIPNFSSLADVFAQDAPGMS